MTPKRLLSRLAASQSNVAFSDLVRLAVALGFRQDRTKGSHRIFVHRAHTEAMLNLQPDRGQAKPYQVRQLLKLAEAYNLRLDEEP